MNDFPKILVSAPTARVKAYCFEEWIDHVMNFSYPNFDVKLLDNTIDDVGLFTKYMNDYFKNNYGPNNEKFKAENYFSYMQKPPTSVIERMSISHNDCAKAAIDGGYTHLLHLETDVFPPKDVIEHLMFHKQKVAGGVFYRDEGSGRRLMVQRHIHRSPNNVVASNLTREDDTTFLDGSLKKVASIGLGCVLISVEVLKKIPFRFIKGENLHPDTFFGEDCFRNKIPIYADTNIICAHINKSWGVHGVDYT